MSFSSYNKNNAVTKGKGSPFGESVQPKSDMEVESQGSSSTSAIVKEASFVIEEATIKDIQSAFKENRLTSKELVKYYLDKKKQLNPIISAVIEVNPDAEAQAEKADRERNLPGGCLSGIHGIPVMLKDNISSKDNLETAAGSLALVGSVVPRDSGVVDRLRKAGAVILGKVGLTEWANYRSPKMCNGWNARSGYVKNPYALAASPGGSSTGSAVAVAANLVTISLGTETSGSIVDPCHVNCVVGMKPTLGLTSRAGVIPITLRQDTVGPIGRTVSDAVYLLDEIVGYDSRDEITKDAVKYIPDGGFKQYLKKDGLKGKRLGNQWHAMKQRYCKDPKIVECFEQHFRLMRENGATLEEFDITDSDTAMCVDKSGLSLALKYEFKRDINAYLSNLLGSRIRSLADAIKFNEDHRTEEKMEEFGQAYFIESEKTTLPSTEYNEAVHKLADLSEKGFEAYMKDHNLDAMVAPGPDASTILSYGGYPEIIVPAGFDSEGVPFGILFGGLKGSDAKLIEIAYAFEQATNVRRKPTPENMNGV